jgi:hypothetical protein
VAVSNPDTSSKSLLVLIRKVQELFRGVVFQTEAYQHLFARGHGFQVEISVNDMCLSDTIPGIPRSKSNFSAMRAGSPIPMNHPIA